MTICGAMRTARIPNAVRLSVGQLPAIVVHPLLAARIGGHQLSPATRSDGNSIALGCRRCGVPAAPVPYTPDDRPARSQYWERGNRRQYDGARNWTKQMQRVPLNDHIYRITNQVRDRPSRPVRTTVPKPDKKPDPAQRKTAILRNILKQVPVQFMAGGGGGSGGGGLCEDRPQTPRDSDEDAEEKERYRGVTQYCKGPNMVMHPPGEGGASTAAADAVDGGPGMCFQPGAPAAFSFGCCARRRGA